MNPDLAKLIFPNAVRSDGGGSFTRIGSYASHIDEDGVLQVVGADVPRFGRDGLLIEPTGTNIATWSEALGAGDWTKSNVTITADVAAAPDLTTTADRAADTSSGAVGTVTQTKAGQSAGPKVYMHFFKPETSSIVRLFMTQNGVTFGADFALVGDGTSANSNGMTAPSARYIEELAGGWYLCAIFGTFAGGTSVTFGFSPAPTSALGAADVNSLTGSVLAWGADYKASAALQTYIRTTTAGVTRGADTITGTGLIWSSVPSDAYADWSSVTSYQVGDIKRRTFNGKPYLYRAKTGRSFVVTISNSNPAVFTAADHGLAAGDDFYLTTTGTLPTGLSPNVTYYATDVGEGDFGAAKLPGNPALGTTGAGSGTHTAVVSVNLNKPPESSPDDWELIAPNNRGAMFDDQVTSQTTATDRIDVIFRPGPFSAMSIHEMVGDCLWVQVLDGVSSGALAYYDPVDLTLDVVDSPTYERQQTYLMCDEAVAALNDPLVALSITGDGAVACGLVAPGEMVELGSWAGDPDMDQVDYSPVETNQWGIVEVTQRTPAKTLEGRMLVLKNDVNRVMRIRRAATGRRTVLVALDEPKYYEGMIIYGIVEKFSGKRDEAGDVLFSVRWRETI